MPRWSECMHTTASVSWISAVTLTTPTSSAKILLRFPTIPDFLYHFQTSWSDVEFSVTAVAAYKIVNCGTVRRTTAETRITTKFLRQYFVKVSFYVIDFVVIALRANTIL